MNRKIRWGVVGSGGIANRRTLPEGLAKAAHTEVIAVYDVRTDLNKKIADEYHARPANSLQELLSMDIDAVYVATPVHVHLQQVLACADYKKHVLCEKPLAYNVPDAEQMALACRQAGVILGTAFMMRFQAQHQAALRLIRDGRIGQPVFARAQLSCWYPPMAGAWRQDPVTSGGGSLMDMGGHCIDLLEMFFGSVHKLSCFINHTVHGYASEDSAIVNLFFENGALATIDTFFCIPDAASKNVLELYGSKGSILAKGTIGQSAIGEMTAFLPGNSSDYDAQQGRSDLQGVAILPATINTYQAEIEEFNTAILENRQPSISADLGLRNQKILSACYQSAKSGRVFTLQ